MKRVITEQWISLVRKKLSERGMSQNALAVEVDATSAGMSQTLSGSHHSSRLVEPISEYLGIDLPPLDADEPEVQELSEILASLTQEDRELLMANARRLKSTK
jgi:predicted transcriptional regulator